jgi:hypothetical protein
MHPPLAHCDRPQLPGSKEPLRAESAPLAITGEPITLSNLVSFLDPQSGQLGLAVALLTRISTCLEQSLQSYSYSGMNSSNESQF